MNHNNPCGSYTINHRSNNTTILATEALMLLALCVEWFYIVFAIRY